MNFYQKIIIFTIAFIGISSCASFNPVKFTAPKFNVVNDKSIDFHENNNNFFIIGGCLSENLEIIDNVITNLKRTDSVTFYKVDNKYSFVRNPLLLIDTMKPFSYLILSNNNFNNNYSVIKDSYVAEKIVNDFKYVKDKSALKVTRNKLFWKKRNNGDVDISYRYEIMLQPFMKDKPVIKEIVIAEVFSGNLVIDNVSIIEDFLVGDYKKDDFNELSWSFNKTSGSNSLTISMNLSNKPLKEYEKKIFIYIEGQLKSSIQ